MAAIAEVLAHTFSETQSDVGPPKTIFTLCGLGLVVSLLPAAYGLDLGACVL
jgi:hypothetical protein